IDERWLDQAYLQTRKDGAVGVDGQTAQDYQRNLQANLKSLLDRAKSGTYQAPPVRRAYIPKGTGPETRPLGIPTFEDTVLQRAVVMVLEPLYEQDFLDCSYGFRPGRSAHQALQTLWDSNHPGSWYTAGRGDLTNVGQHLPTLCAGCLVPNVPISTWTGAAG